MFPLVTSALGILSKTRLGERVQDKIGNIMQNIGRKRREGKNRASDVNQTADINAVVADMSPVYAAAGPVGFGDKLGKALKGIKEAAGPIETENVVKADKSMYIVAGIIAAAVLAAVAFRK